MFLVHDTINLATHYLKLLVIKQSIHTLASRYIRITAYNKEKRHNAHLFELGIRSLLETPDTQLRYKICVVMFEMKRKKLSWLPTTGSIIMWLPSSVNL